MQGKDGSPGGAGFDRITPVPPSPFGCPQVDYRKVGRLTWYRALVAQTVTFDRRVLADQIVVNLFD